MPKRPPGLKTYPAAMSPDEVTELLALCRSLPPPPGNPLFRYFGDFGSNKGVEPVAPWMPRWGELMVARGFFKEPPNQYRVTHWIGDLRAQFKWHIDSQRHGERILVISLTDGRQIGFRPRAKPQEPYMLEQNAGDIYIIRATARWQWEHCVMPAGADRGGGESFVMAWRRS
jgi:hypothetical protein